MSMGQEERVTITPELQAQAMTDIVTPMVYSGIIKPTEIALAAAAVTKATAQVPLTASENALLERMTAAEPVQTTGSSLVAPALIAAGIALVLIYA